MSKGSLLSSAAIVPLPPIAQLEARERIEGLKVKPGDKVTMLYDNVRSRLQVNGVDVISKLGQWGVVYEDGALYWGAL